MLRVPHNAPIANTQAAHQRSANRGFTVVELMAVVAIVSILAVLAMSSYGEYTIRSKVTEGLSFASEAKTSVTEYYYSTNVMPHNNQQTGLRAPSDYQDYDFIERLDIITVGAQGGVIAITLSIPELGSENILYLQPSTAEIPMSWTCTAPAVNGVENSRLPPNCRSDLP